MVKPPWIEDVNFLDKTPMDYFTYSAEICDNSEMYPAANFSKALHDSHKFPPANIYNSLSPHNQDSYPGTGVPQDFSGENSPKLPFEDNIPFNKVPVYSQGSENETSVNFGNQERCGSPQSRNQDVYFNMKRDTEAPYDDSYINLYNTNTFEAYSPENGEMIASVSPDHNHINALFTQTSHRVETCSYDGHITKINVLTPNELSINAANELAALQMNAGLAGDGMLNDGETNSNIAAADANKRKNEAKLFHLQHPDDESTLSSRYFERNNNQLKKSEAGWQMTHQWEEEVKEELNYDTFQEPTPGYWMPQSKTEHTELKNLSTSLQSKFATEELVNQPIVNNITLQYGPTYTIVQAPSENTFSYHPIEVEHGRHVYQQGQDGQQYNVGQFVIGEDPLESYQQKNDYLVRTKKPGLSAWQRKQAKSAGICVVCSDKSSGWHYNACEGCKGFFKRSVTKKSVYLPCKFSGTCNITLENRRKCQTCRLEKCYKMGMKEECMQSTETKVAPKRKMEVKVEDNSEDNPRSGKRARNGGESEISIEQREKLVFLTNCLQVWLSPSADEMEEDDLMQEILSDGDHSGRALAMRLDLQFQSFINFANHLLGGNAFQEASHFIKMRCFQSALLLRYAVNYNQAQLFDAGHQWSYDKATLKLVGIEKETTTRFFQSVCKLNLDLTEIGLLSALIIFTNHPTSFQENVVMQEDVFSDLLTVYEEQKQGGGGRRQRAGVRLGLILDLLNQLAGLPRVDSYPHLLLSMPKAPGAA